MNYDALLAESNENVPRDLSDWANLAGRLRSALDRANRELKVWHPGYINDMGSASTASITCGSSNE